MYDIADKTSLSSPNYLSKSQMMQIFKFYYLTLTLSNNLCVCVFKCNVVMFTC